MPLISDTEEYDINRKNVFRSSYPFRNLHISELSNRVPLPGFSFCRQYRRKPHAYHLSFMLEKTTIVLNRTSLNFISIASLHLITNHEIIFVGIRCKSVQWIPLSWGLCALKEWEKCCFQVVVFLRRERSDDRKYVCDSQATLGREMAHFSEKKSVRIKSQEFSRKFKRSGVCLRDFQRFVKSIVPMNIRRIRSHLRQEITFSQFQLLSFLFHLPKSAYTASIQANRKIAGILFLKSARSLWLLRGHT